MKLAANVRCMKIKNLIFTYIKLLVSVGSNYAWQSGILRDQLFVNDGTTITSKGQ